MFTITLQSGVSNAGEFEVVLNKDVDCTAGYEVILNDIVLMPGAWLNVRPGTNWVIIESKEHPHPIRVEIESKHYNTRNDLLQEINKAVLAVSQWQLSKLKKMGDVTYTYYKVKPQSKVVKAQTEFDGLTNGLANVLTNVLARPVMGILPISQFFSKRASKRASPETLLELLKYENVKYVNRETWLQIIKDNSKTIAQLLKDGKLEPGTLLEILQYVQNGLTTPATVELTTIEPIPVKWAYEKMDTPALWDLEHHHDGWYTIGGIFLYNVSTKFQDSVRNEPHKAAEALGIDGSKYDGDYLITNYQYLKPGMFPQLERKLLADDGCTLVWYAFDEDRTTTIKLSPDIAVLLGYIDNVVENVPTIPHLKAQLPLSYIDVHKNTIPMIFLHADFIYTTTYNSKQSDVLKIISIFQTTGYPNHSLFETGPYIPVQRRVLRKIRFYITDSMDSTTPMKMLDKVTIVLHFRPRYYNMGIR